MLKIVADENIPYLDDYFSTIGNITRLNGRGISRDQVKNADILLVRSVTKVNEALLRGSSVRFVGTATIGVDHLDVLYLESQNIKWANAPGCNANSVVDYVLSSFCHIDGLWLELFGGARVGIIGYGNVGRCLQRRLTALNINCFAYDPLLPEDDFNTHDLNAVLRSDVVCSHAPLTKHGEFPSYHMLNKHNLVNLKENAVFISAGRGAVVDNAELLSILSARPDITAVMDVWEGEPVIDTSLLPYVAIGTPHIAGYSLDGKAKGTQMIYQSCSEYLSLPIHATHETTDPIDIQIPSHLDDVAAFIYAIQQVYDVREDDNRFRLAMSIDIAQRGLAFDALRKNYPERLEFSRYKISSSHQLSDQLIDWLKAAGFQI